VLGAVREVPQQAWDALVPAGGAPFLEWAWIDALEQSGSVAPERGWHPRHFTLWRGQTLVSAAPGYLKDHSQGEFVFDWSWASAAERAGIHYYPKLILAVPLTPATGPRFLAAPGEDAQARARDLARAALEHARQERLSSVHVLFPTETELAWLEAEGFAPRSSVQYHWVNRGYRTYEDFLARFQSKRRHQLRRERRAAAEQGLTLRTIRGEALEDVDPGEVYRLYRSTVDRYLWGKRHLNRAFFEQILQVFRHHVELVEVRRGETLIAGTFNLATDKVLYGRYWGAFEEVPFLHFHACLYHPVEECIARGRERFEPGAGGDHKLTRGFEPSLTFSAHWIAHAGLDRAVRQFLQSEGTAIREGLPQWRKEMGFKQVEEEAQDRA
jgi:hypothetical protein